MPSISHRECLRKPSHFAALAFCLLALMLLLRKSAAQEKSFVLKPNVGSLTLIGGKAEAISYRGVTAIHLSQSTGADGTLAIVNDLDFKDGTIELEIAGAPAVGAPDSARGFVGIAFRVAQDNGHFECVYLRPTNGRADDQLRRNHSTQYVSLPDFPWERLRKESPGVYESYVDLEPGVLAKYKLVVNGKKAALYVHGADQPCLIVNDLKGTATHGKIGLWIGTGAEGYFSGLKITPAR
jgi:hypothetical protein